MKFIGITGGVGAGKSAILKFLHDHYKCKIYMADKVAFEVRLPGTECHRRLCELLGEEVVSDRRLMAEKIYGDEELLSQVNNIIHPAVREFLVAEQHKAEKEGKAELFFVEAALLIECGYCELVDEMWYVYADEDTRIKRLMSSRAYSEEKARAIMAQQLSDEEFRLNSDFVIDNSGDLMDAKNQIRRRLEGFTWQR